MRLHEQRSLAGNSGPEPAPQLPSRHSSALQDARTAREPHPALLSIPRRRSLCTLGTHGATAGPRLSGSKSSAAMGGSPRSSAGACLLALVPSTHSGKACRLEIWVLRSSSLPSLAAVIVVVGCRRLEVAAAMDKRQKAIEYALSLPWPDTPNTQLVVGQAGERAVPDPADARATGGEEFEGSGWTRRLRVCGGGTRARALHWPRGRAQKGEGLFPACPSLCPEPCRLACNPTRSRRRALLWPRADDGEAQHLWPVPRLAQAAGRPGDAQAAGAAGGHAERGGGWSARPLRSTAAAHQGGARLLQVGSHGRVQEATLGPETLKELVFFRGFGTNEEGGGVLADNPTSLSSSVLRRHAL